MSNKLVLKFKEGQLPVFLEKLETLSKIDDTIKVKIDRDDILIYSIMGREVMLAFQNFVLKTSDFFELDESFSGILDIVILQAKKFVKNLQFIKGDDVAFTITWKPSPDDENIGVARSLKVTGGKLKINWILGESYEIRDIEKNSLSERLDIKNRKWHFSITKDDFSDIKKLSNINSERIINISINSGKVILSERGSWELEVDNTDEDRNAGLMLNKKFLASINDEEECVTFNIFPSFMLFKNENSNLMLSFEQNFEDDE